MSEFSKGEMSLGKRSRKNMLNIIEAFAGPDKFR